MTVRQTAMVGFDGGKGATRAAAGVVAPPRRIPSPTSCGGGSIRPLGGLAGLADVVGALLALGGPAALAVQGEPLQKLAQQGVHARRKGATRQGFVKPRNESETVLGRLGRLRGQGGEGPRQHRVPANSGVSPSARLREGALSAAPTSASAAVLAAATWMERPTQRVVWPVAPDVPASPLKAGRGRHGEGALFISAARRRRRKGPSRALVEFPIQRRELLGREKSNGDFRDRRRQHHPATDRDNERRHIELQILNVATGELRLSLKAAVRLQAGLIAAVVAELGHSPRRHGYGPSGWMTRTSWRSGRNDATGTAPAEILSIAMARSVGQGSAPLSRLLMRPRDDSPNLLARSA